MFQKSGCHLTGFEVKLGELCALKQFFNFFFFFTKSKVNNGLVRGDFCSLPMST